MKLRLKKRWVEALRSGNYDQGTYRLRNGGDGFCCLGVLCDIIGPDDATSPGGWTGERTVYAHGEYRSTTSIPDLLAEEIGISTGFQGMLARMNDHGHSFGKIADFIEEATI